MLAEPGIETAGSAAGPALCVSAALRERDLARLSEVAAFQTKLKMSGYNPAKELNDRLISKMAAATKL